MSLLLILLPLSLHLFVPKPLLMFPFPLALGGTEDVTDATKITARQSTQSFPCGKGSLSQRQKKQWEDAEDLTTTTWGYGETVRSRMILEIILPEVTPDEIQSQWAQQGATDPFFHNKITCFHNKMMHHRPLVSFKPAILKALSLKSILYLHIPNCNSRTVLKASDELIDSGFNSLLYDL